MALEALAVKIRDLKGKGCMEPEAQAVDGGEGDLGVQGGGGGQELPDLRHTADSGEPVGSVRAQERQNGPVTPQDMLRAEAQPAGADTPGRWGEAVDVFAMQEVRLECLFGEAVGCCVIALSPQVYFPDRGRLGTLSPATQLQGGNPVLTQWSHKASLCVH
jgi:hypothetical protein